jgi:hypothetical protein
MHYTHARVYPLSKLSKQRIGLLHKVSGIVQRAGHAVTMEPDFAAERFGDFFKRWIYPLRNWRLTT